MPPYTILCTAHAFTPAGLELNLNLTTHHGDLYITEKREGETGREADKTKQKKKQGDRNWLKFHSYFIPQSNTERQAAR